MTARPTPVGRPALDVIPFELPLILRLGTRYV